MKYFLKEIFQNGLIDNQGKPFQFEPIGGSYGVMAVDENTAEGASIVTQLNALHNAKIGGVVPITEGEYSAKKAEFPLPVFAPNLETLRVLQTQRPQMSQNGVNAAGAEPIKPAFEMGKVPTTPPPPAPVFTPRRGRLPQNAAQAAELKAIEAAKIPAVA